MGMFGFNGFMAVFSVMFVLITGFIIFTLVKGIGQWSKNNHSPVLTVEARIVTKRVARNVHHMDAGNNTTVPQTFETFYATFEFESRDRMELVVPWKAYGLLAEGDMGRLTFQGTRYLDFVRNR
jgi:hypothetical protein